MKARPQVLLLAVVVLAVAARAAPAAAYDSARNLTVLFSGEESGGTIPDTWEWNGTAWRRGPDGPRPLAQHVMAYDQERRQIEARVAGAGKSVENVLSEASGLLSGLTRAAGVGKMQLRAARSMRSSKATTKATLTGGDNKVPFFNGAEFGSGMGIRKDVGGRNGPNPGLGWYQFLPWKEPGNGRTGYFLFPTMRAETEAIKEMYTRELDDICKIAFPNGRL